MQDLIRIDSRPARLDVNFEELKKHLATELKKYDLVVTAGTVGSAKKLATDLNKQAADLDRKRKAAITEVSAPIKQADDQMKELVGMYKDGRQKILSQVEKFEDETRALAKKLLAHECWRLWAHHKVDDGFRRAEFEDLVLLTSVTGTGNLSAKAKGELESRVMADVRLQDQTEKRLLALENSSYKAGLAAPLTRDHVQHFLFADDAAYEHELQRIIDAEITRQEAAEQRMREQMEREQRQKEQAEDERKAREERGRQQPAQKEENTEEAALEAESIRSRRAEPGPADAREETAASAGRAQWVVTCAFEIQTGPGVTPEQIEHALRKRLAEANITTLDSVTVQRRQKAA